MSATRTLKRYRTLVEALDEAGLRRRFLVQEIIADYDDDGAESEERYTGMTGIYYNDKCLLHEDAEEESVEAPRRAKEIYEGLQREGLVARCRRVEGRKATKAEICTVHTAPYFRMIEDTKYKSIGTSRLSRVRSQQGIHLDEEKDTYFNEYSFDAACLSTGGLLEVTERVVEGRLKNGFAIIRPPGHHAEKCKAMGFCLFNHVAITAKVIKQKYKEVEKILIVDWDVHHGNGTQKSFFLDPDVLYFSIHRYENGSFFPGSGKISSVGRGAGVGKTVNVPLPCAGFGDSEYIQIFEQILMPITREFKPDLLIVSAGFDSSLGDIGEMKVTQSGFAQMMSMLANTDVIDDGKIVVALEGGYNIDSLVSSAVETVKVLLGMQAPVIPSAEDMLNFSTHCERRGYERNIKRFADVLARVINEQSRFWKCFRKLLPQSPRATRQSTHQNGLPQLQREDDHYDHFKKFVTTTTHLQYVNYLGRKVKREYKGEVKYGYIIERIFVGGQNKWTVKYEDGECRSLSKITVDKNLVEHKELSLAANPFRMASLSSSMYSGRATYGLEHDADGFDSSLSSSSKAADTMVTFGGDPSPLPMKGLEDKIDLEHSVGIVASSIKDETKEHFVPFPLPAQGAERSEDTCDGMEIANHLSHPSEGRHLPVKRKRKSEYHPSKVSQEGSAIVKQPFVSKRISSIVGGKEEHLNDRDPKGQVTYMNQLLDVGKGTYKNDSEENRGGSNVQKNSRILDKVDFLSLGMKSTLRRHDNKRLRPSSPVQK